MTKELIENNEGKVLDYHHILFWVANAKTASSYFVTRLGFRPVGVREPTEDRKIISYAVRQNKITLIFESPTAEGPISRDLQAHGDFVKDISFKVENLDELVKRAWSGGAEIIQDISTERDQYGVVRYAILRTYGDNTHTLIDCSNYKGELLPGYQIMQDDAVNDILPETQFLYIDHVEGNMKDDSLEDSVAWYRNNLNMQRFWCMDYKTDWSPFSNINSASVYNKEDTVLLSMNEAAKGRRPTSKASEFVKALGTSGVEHIALNTDDIVTTIRNLKARGADMVSWPPTYYDIIREKLKDSTLKMAENIDVLQELNILIDFDEKGYMLQAFTKHLQTRPTVFLEVLQRRNHRGFGVQNYKWIFEAIERLEDFKKNNDTAIQNYKVNDKAEQDSKDNGKAEQDSKDNGRAEQDSKDNDKAAQNSKTTNDKVEENVKTDNDKEGQNTNTDNETLQ